MGIKTEGGHSMLINKEWKRKLNFIIPYYRKKFLRATKEACWKQAHFYYDQERSILICPSSTYSKMENNKVIADESVYLFAIEKLKKKLIMNVNVENEINNIIGDIYCALENNNIDLVKEIYINREYLLNGSVDNIYYDECIFVFSRLKMHFVDCIQVKKEDFEKIDFLYPIYPKQLQEIIIYFLQSSADVVSEDPLGFLLKKYSFENYNCFVNKLIFFDQLIYEKKEERAHQFILVLIDEAKRVNNVNQFSILLSKFAVLISERDTSECNKYIVKVTELIKYSRVNLNITFIAWKNIAIAAMYMENYKLMESSIKIIMQNDHRKDVSNIIYLNFCAHMLKKEFNTNDYDFYIDSRRSYKKIDLELLNYFMGYKKRDSYKNIQFIMKNISPKLTKFDKFYIAIINKELYRLCEDTNHYKNYIAYRIKHNLQI